ncbi:hypothetical protein CEXT_88691 [Caerostris extrusa]|uniref:Uncharacterized protein n=1 Tax=Caerostris extrusa TaxID=172846 RepID=A0AAV4X8L4_CAEEX|nr:hypothetical protein CEXT_88691 [Caerostris extrusa]
MDSGRGEELSKPLSSSPSFSKQQQGESSSVKAKGNGRKGRKNESPGMVKPRREAGKIPCIFLTPHFLILFDFQDRSKRQVHLKKDESVSSAGAG